MGGMGYLPISERFDVPMFKSSNDSSIYPLSFHTLAHPFAFFFTPQKPNSFIFKRFRTLCKKTGEGASQRSASSCGVLGNSAWSKWATLSAPRPANHESPVTSHQSRVTKLGLG